MSSTRSSVPSLLLPGAGDIGHSDFTPDTPEVDRGRIWLPGDDDGELRYRHRSLASGTPRKFVVHPFAGPFTVYPAGGNESADYIKIDPANKKIEAAGTARPTRSIPLHVAQYLDGAAAVKTLAPNVGSLTTLHDPRTEAVLLTPFEAPTDMDLAEPWSVYVWVGIDPSVGFPPFTSKVAAFEIHVTVFVHNGNYATTSVTGGTVNALLSLSRFYRFIAPDDGASSFPAGVINNAGELVGIEVRRRSDLAADTFNVDLAVAGFTVEYVAKEY